MSDFIHKKVIPIVPKKWQDYLLQHYTIIFQNGFEEGDFSAWTGTVIQGSGSLAVSSGSAHHGSYKATASNSSQSDAYCRYLEANGYTIAYAREYVKISAYPNENAYTGFIGLVGSADAYTKAGAGIKNNHWAAYYLTSVPGDAFYESAVTFSLDTWYCLEVKGVVSTTVGEVRVYVDGTEIITWTGLDTSYGQIYGMRCGLSCWQTGTVTIIFDCCVYADTGPIGPEVPVVVAKVIAKADTGPSPRSKLGFNPTTLKL
jgi:hypothetical protein